jgi:hypothetical protein
LIDWHLLPILAVFQLYHGKTIQKLGQWMFIVNWILAIKAEYIACVDHYSNNKKTKLRHW